MFFLISENKYDPEKSYTKNTVGDPGFHRQGRQPQIQGMSTY